MLHVVTGIVAHFLLPYALAVLLLVMLSLLLLPMLPLLLLFFLAFLVLLLGFDLARSLLGFLGFFFGQVFLLTLLFILYCVDLIIEQIEVDSNAVDLGIRVYHWRVCLVLDDHVFL